MAVNDIRLLTEDTTLRDQMQASENKPIKLDVYSTREQALRKVEMTPTRKWGDGKDGLIGCSIQFCLFDTISDIVWHDIAKDSPAERAGLCAHADYIIGTPLGVIRGEGDLYDLVEDYIGELLPLYVYNVDADEVREVVIIPAEEWGGEGLLGCDVGYGYLHRLPKNTRRYQAAGGPHSEEQMQSATVEQPSQAVGKQDLKGAEAKDHVVTAPVQLDGNGRSDIADGPVGEKEITENAVRNREEPITERGNSDSADMPAEVNPTEPGTDVPENLDSQQQTPTSNTDTLMNEPKSKEITQSEDTPVLDSRHSESSTPSPMVTSSSAPITNQSDIANENNSDLLPAQPSYTELSSNQERTREGPIPTLPAKHAASIESTPTPISPQKLANQTSNEDVSSENSSPAPEHPPAASESKPGRRAPPLAIAARMLPPGIHGRGSQSRGARLGHDGHPVRENTPLKDVQNQAQQQSALYREQMARYEAEQAAQDSNGSDEQENEDSQNQQGTQDVNPEVHEYVVEGMIRNMALGASVFPL
ncbi:Golgi reassembly-stacking protein 2 [Gamsiella multidivaricata]|nr:Golgi reassembly-stacking protein 2 [Gamsiella multidivaricata]